MTKVPCRDIPTAVTKSPEVRVGPVDLGLGRARAIEGGAGVAVQEYVILSRRDAVNGGRLHQGSSMSS